VENNAELGGGEGVVVNLFLNTATWASLPVILPETNWIHMAFTYCSANGLFQLFTNGVLATSTTNDASGTIPLIGQLLRQTTLPLNFGGDTLPGLPLFAAGYMDEVRIWNTNRTGDQIAETRFCRLTGTESNLAAYWNFDGTNAIDLTGNGNNGTLEGGAQIVPIVGNDAIHAGVCGELSPIATASAVLENDFVVGATLTDGGYGYSNTPSVKIIGGGGSGAQAVAVVSNGVVIGVDVLNAGSGYTNTPLVVIDPPFIPNPVLDIAPMSGLLFSNLTVGGVYQLQQSVEWYWTNQPGNFTAANSVYTQIVSGRINRGDYRLALSPVPAQAFAVADVDNGFVVGATITTGGSGYVTNPAVSIVSNDGGTNAGGFCEISGGVVTSITITNAGFDYTNTPTIEITPPPAAAVFPDVQLVMRVDSASLAPYDNYQIQFKPALGKAWGNWNGGLFSPTDVTNSQYLFVTNASGFFRLKYVP
jgi:hypothetical protein